MSSLSDESYRTDLGVVVSEIIDACFKYGDEEATRSNIKETANKMLGDTNTPHARNLITDAYIRICRMSYLDIEEIYESMHDYTPDYEEEEEKEPTIEIDASLYKDVIYDYWHSKDLRDELLSHNNCDITYFFVHNEDNDSDVYGIKCKIKYENDYYFLLTYPIWLKVPGDQCAVVYTFYKLEMAEDPGEDKLVRVKDENLKNKLKEIANEIYPPSDNN